MRSAAGVDHHEAGARITAAKDPLVNHVSTLILTEVKPVLKEEGSKAMEYFPALGFSTIYSKFCGMARLRNSSQMKVFESLPENDINFF